MNRNKREKIGAIMGAVKWMLGCIAVLSACFLLVGCKRTRAAGASVASGDVSRLAFEKLHQYGGSNVPLSEVVKRYEFMEDEHGLQVWLDGDNVAAFLSVLEPHFGSPAIVNSNQNSVQSFHYSARQTGGDIKCSSSSDRMGGDPAKAQIWTHLLLLRNRALQTRGE